MARVVVEGESMTPALSPGDRLWIWSWLKPRPGDVIVMADPRDQARTMVKRVALVDPTTRAFIVEGDNPAASTDSRHFGPVSAHHYRGRVVCRYAPRGRVTRIHRTT